MSIAELEQRLAPPVRSFVGPRPSRRRLGDLRREPPTPRRRSLVVDQGCDVRIGHVRLEPAVVLALLQWLPLAHSDVGFLERGEPAEPVVALGLVLRPPTIWSPVEALAARGRAHDMAGLGRYAAGRVAALHVRRVRRTATRIAGQLPLTDLPRTSEIVASGCATVIADEALCADAAAMQLVRYATSDLIRRL